MIPGQHGNPRCCEELANGGHDGVQREFRAESQVQNTFSRVSRWGIGADERPTSVEHSPPKFLRDVQGFQAGRAQGRYHQGKLEVRHSWSLDIQGLHGDNISRSRLGESIWAARLHGTTKHYGRSTGRTQVA